MDIAVIGGYGVGQVFRVKRFPGAGESLTADSFEAMHGGKGSNQAVAASRLGARVSLLSAVGRDAWSSGARDLWRDHGVDDHHVRDAPEATMLGAIIVDDTGENRIVIAPGALIALSTSDADAFRDRISRSDLLVISLEVPLDVAVHAMGIAREESTRVLLNPAPAANLPLAVLDEVDYLTPNLTEAALLAGLTGQASPAAIIERLRTSTSAHIALTLGSDGVLVSSPGRPTRHVPAVAPRRVVDTTGAGDAFTAALAVAICAGAEFLDAVTWAAAAGSHAVASAGVISALPHPKDLPPMPRSQV